ncbi:MAG: hypothetical protein AAF682_31875 [Planctomycetota bacterium]
MNTKHISLVTLLASAAAAATAFAFQNEEAPSSAPATLEQSEVRLLFAQPFQLDHGYAHAWRADQPPVTAGYLVALRAEAELLPPMQIHHPLMFAGEMPLERINDGSDSGVYIGILPSATGSDGAPTLDLKETPIFWSKPDILPESLSIADARRVLSQAVAAGVEPQADERVDDALAEGGGTVYVSGLGALRRYAADVIERYSPLETDLVSGLRAPLLKK